MTKITGISESNASDVRVRLRVLATSDLHMQLVAYDYVNDQKTGSDSLVQLATIIRQAQSEARETGAMCLLVDNGDTLQGTPMGGHLAMHPGLKHPMAAAMNDLGYDAIGIGNHDCDHGLAYLARCLDQFDAPAISANLRSDALPELRTHIVLEKNVPGLGNTEDVLRVGIVSALPRQTASWNRHQLEGQAQVADPIPALEEAIAAAKAEGADIVVALAHMGIAQFDEGDDAQNQTAEVAQLKNVDAVVAGHTHLKFPGPDHSGVNGVDCENGMINGTPVVMPGCSASELGVIDLDLHRPARGGSWQVTERAAALRHPTKETVDDRAVEALAQEAHVQTRTYLSQPVATLAGPMHSYFALAHPSHVPAMMAEAKRFAIQQAIIGTELADLPLIAAVATPATGGFDGPENFVSLPAGQLRRRHIAGLIPYSNQVWAVKASGARLSGWLERSALLFNVLSADTPDQMLVDPKVPGFRYDALYGLTYEIDLTQPSRFDAAGRPVEGAPGRVGDIRWQGEPVHPDQEFLVAVTDHRAGGGGTFRAFSDNNIVVRNDAPLSQALIEYLKNPDYHVVRSAAPWRFKADLGLRAFLHTAPDALNHLHDIAHLRPEACGYTRDGFVRLRLHL
ncbi:5'-nucleotidase C-terminal domain-containing protein [uncultured Roseobacter sp.]|uniref:5'-nucleotidase C-terminal domain-containing protein n=1 Tax=uncultured Roseobacter sp. TaxID=114847 RepID=UPI002637DBAF|nr:5'-nucleotidase C-terminal domain-containing protein [uncultured Roseobacter sp.]